jgi:uncharacterized membrane protein YfcA
LLSKLPGEALAPWVAGYLAIMGAVIVAKAFREFPPRAVTTHLAPLGFFGALVDAAGGGGWGPIVGSTLIVRGASVRLTIGSVNAVEFFVTLAASTTFFVTMGVTHWPIVLGLAVGGALGAPIGAWACRRVPVKPFMVLVGLLVIALSGRTLWRMFA